MGNFIKKSIFIPKQIRYRRKKGTQFSFLPCKTNFLKLIILRFNQNIIQTLSLDSELLTEIESMYMAQNKHNGTKMLQNQMVSIGFWFTSFSENTEAISV